MALPGSLARHMNETVIYERCLSATTRDARTYDTAVPYTRCRVVEGGKAVRNAQGKLVTSMRQVIFDRVITTMSVLDRLTLPDGSQPPIQNFNSHKRSPVGSDLGHTEVFL